MPRQTGMAEAVEPHTPSVEWTRRRTWLTEKELDVYVSEFSRTGFQGGLNWYRCTYSDGQRRSLSRFDAQRSRCANLFYRRCKDWGIYQRPGGLDIMSEHACTDFRGIEVIENAGHWVQQEQPEAVFAALQSFFLATGVKRCNSTQ